MDYNAYSIMPDSGDTEVPRSAVVTDEERWVEAARAGDKAAFGRLVEAYQGPIYNLAYRMLGNASEAEEAAQEAFIRAYKHLRSYDPQRPFSTWLFSIASHYCIDRIRRRRIDWLPLKEEIAEPVRLASASPNPESVVTERDREAWIQDLMNTLSPTDRAALTLHYWYDAPYSEIAEVLGLTVSAVKSRLYRARRALAEQMEGETYAL
jgi:RNA polymerase sigma-70 factor (ECF subfamily)